MWRSRASIDADAKKSKMTTKISKKLKTSKFQIKYVFFWVSIDAKKAENYNEYFKKLKTSMFKIKYVFFFIDGDTKKVLNDGTDKMIKLAWIKFISYLYKKLCFQSHTFHQRNT